MKIAKKVLAVVMAIAMVAALSAMAFAADAKVALVATAEDGTVAVAVYFKDAVGLKSWDTTITYDKDVLEFDYVDDGADAAQVGDTKSNSFSYEYNPDTEGEITFSGFFKTQMDSHDDFAADAKKGKTVDINSDNFEAVVIYFNVKNADATKTDISIAVTSKSGAEITGSSTTAQLKEETTPVEPGTDKEEPGTDKEEPASGTPNPNTGDDDKPTGDNMALVAASAVVVLAGAAFVISKKRK